MKKTSRGLVEYAKSMIGMPYVCGTYGKIGSRDILELKRRQYPEQLGRGLRLHTGKLGVL